MERHKFSFACKYWKKVETNNKSIALNVLFFPQKREIYKRKMHFKVQFTVSKPGNPLNSGIWQKNGIKLL